MRLIDGDQRDLDARGEIEKVCGQKPLRRDIDDFILPMHGVFERAAVLPQRQAAVEVCRRYARRNERAHLVLH